MHGLNITTVTEINNQNKIKSNITFVCNCLWRHCVLMDDCYLFVSPYLSISIKSDMHNAQQRLVE